VEVLTIIIILFSHYVSDFLLQNDKMATKKSKNVYWLGTHCIVYMISLSSIIALFSITPLIQIDNYLHLQLFAFGNGVLHFIVDYLTSRWARRLYNKNKRRAFFNVIGFDQLIHMTALLVSFKLI
jgi:membrane-bound metal-dependent hydrolase YbcI (DUF457 family)